jgi:phosphoribosylglycinamide formyltransferase 1
VRLGVLASGSGTILEAILAAGPPVSLVLSDRPCRALDVAKDHDVVAILEQRDTFGPSFDRDAFTKGVVAALDEHDLDMVAMAGFMTVLGVAMFDRFGERVVNTHPSLLPAFPGANAVRDALAYGVKITGCTVHVATPAVDHGPILAQEAVPVRPDDTEATLHERIKAVERRLYPLTLKELLA